MQSNLFGSNEIGQTNGEGGQEKAETASKNGIGPESQNVPNAQVNTSVNIGVQDGLNILNSTF